MILYERNMQWVSKSSPYSFRVGVSDRRSFLATTSLAAAAWAASLVGGRAATVVPFSAYPFQLGVASGDPDSQGFVIWTRLAPVPLDGGGMPEIPVEVSWQVAEDEAMTRVVKKGEVIARPEWAHSVHVEVDGLRPDRWYWYQFKAGTETSAVGRSRTMPAPGAPAERLKIAFASCQHYESGHYTAYDHMSADDPDIVLHLGDYIYEKSSGKTSAVRRHGDGIILTLEAYRRRHALYRMDPSLMKMHQQVPWIVTWDDHETWNDMAGAAHRSEKELKLRAVGYQAYYEHMPLRRSALPVGPDMKLFRSVRFGDLAEFFVLDTRQYRTIQPSGKTPEKLEAAVMDPKATIMGDEQRGWLFDGLTKSGAAWNVLAQQVMMARVDREPGEKKAYSMDKWGGYETERRALLGHLKDNRINNAVVLTGDIHSNWASDLPPHPDAPDGESVATEFIGTSISSGGDGTAVPSNHEALLSENPFVKFHNKERGYVTCEITRRLWKTDFRTLPFVTKPGAPVVTKASFIVEAERPKLVKA